MIPDEAVEVAVPRITGFFDFRGLMLTNEAAAKLARLTLEAAAPHMLAPILALADKWHAEGEADMAASKTMQDEHIAMVLLTDGATMVENARHIRNAIGVAK